MSNRVKLTGESGHALALGFFQFFNTFFEENVVSVPGGIDGDEGRKGRPTEILSGRLAGHWALDVRLKNLLKSRVGDDETVFAEEFASGVRAGELGDVSDSVEIVGLGDGRHGNNKKAESKSEGQE